MTTSAHISRLTKYIALATASVACLGISSCGPLGQSEKDFVAQHGYQRSDYYGSSYQNRKFVPGEVKAPEYYNREKPERLDGRPLDGRPRLLAHP
ncbi:MAG: hypothetical protein ACSHX9_02095 [Luteolibacter sp.]